jgi:hypothetical protein
VPGGVGIEGADAMDVSYPGLPEALARLSR